ncbi:MAG: RNase adapter RapZ [Lachnospiraceae bacterium]|nr:RNase adapter RapZ [Lachnospiraceae bacterium]
MRFVVVTGMSGGGKRTAMKMLEDAGYYCVDNLPIPLIDKFVELLATPNSEVTKVALGLDVRSDQNFADAEKILDNLVANGYEIEILFLDASDQVLIKRYKESRRMHPLASNGSVEEGIKKERKILKNIKKKSNYVFDTSNLLTRVLKEEMDKIFVNGEEYNSLMLRVLSFGFKYGIPVDADIVFDVRFLPNPFYIDDLKHHTGNEQCVRDYVMGFEEAHEFRDKLVDMVQFLIPNYVKEGKHQLVIAIGCTGGKHRSVTLANELYESIKDKGNYGVTISHRDVEIK